MDDSNPSVAASSGYESAGQRGDSDTGTVAGGVNFGSKVNQGRISSSGLDSDSVSTGSSVRSPPSVNLGRKKYFGSIPVILSNRSKSAPQSPIGGQRPVRLHESLLIDQKAELKRLEENRILKHRQKQFGALKKRQTVLKEELRMAKQRLGIPENKWSYELHVENCMDISHPGLIEALEQETKILEKRVIACKSHALLVTVFDSAPSRL